MNCASNSGQTVDHFSMEVRIPQTGSKLRRFQVASPLKYTQRRTAYFLKKGEQVAAKYTIKRKMGQSVMKPLFSAGKPAF
ncbi:MAG: hypothetical protein CME32_30130 [Gimesia sp.]|nr:hypothetical protein [Gimesia sp.]